MLLENLKPEQAAEVIFDNFGRPVQIGELADFFELENVRTFENAKSLNFPNETLNAYIIHSKYYEHSQIGYNLGLNEPTRRRYFYLLVWLAVNTNKKPGENSKIEILPEKLEEKYPEAYRFSEELLLPKKHLLKKIQEFEDSNLSKEKTITNLSEYFLVLPAHVEKRLKQLNHIIL